MAYYVDKSDTKKLITAEQGLRLWKALHNMQGLSAAEKLRLNNIKVVCLNWRDAPDDYIAENLNMIIPMALNDWAVDARGKPTRPQSDEAWRFARKWGLWANGGPTYLVAAGATRYTQAAMPWAVPVNDR